MNNVEINEKERFFQECRSEDVNENTYCLYRYAVLGIPPICFMEIGDWIWSEDVSKLMKCFKEVIAWDYACAICDNAEYATEDRTAVEILEIYSNDFETSIKDSELTNRLIDLLSLDLNNDKIINDTLKEIFEIINELGVEASYDFCESKYIYDVLMEHYGGELPIYPTLKQQLLEDSIY